MSCRTASADIAHLLTAGWSEVAPAKGFERNAGYVNFASKRRLGTTKDGKWMFVFSFFYSVEIREDRKLQQPRYHSHPLAEGRYIYESSHQNPYALIVSTMIRPIDLK